MDEPEVRLGVKSSDLGIRLYLFFFDCSWFLFQVYALENFSSSSAPDLIFAVVSMTLSVCSWLLSSSQVVSGIVRHVAPAQEMLLVFCSK